MPAAVVNSKKVAAFSTPSGGFNRIDSFVFIMFDLIVIIKIALWYNDQVCFFSFQGPGMKSFSRGHVEF